MKDINIERNNIKTNSVFVLMHYDDEVLSYDVANNKQIILNENLIPWDYNNNFIEWCANRVLSISRKNAKYILNALGVSQDNSEKTRAHLAISYHCISLNDCYWTKRWNESTQWLNISLFRNKSENILTPVSLQGKVSTLFNKRLNNACDITAEGTYRKSWCRVSDGFELLKGDDDSESKEVLREVCASQVLRNLGFNTITYTTREYDGELVSVSKCFTSEKIEYIPYRAIKKKYGVKAIEFITDNFMQDYLKMAIATYIIGNVDLHDGNWGLYKNVETGELSFAALFDFNNAFSKDYLSGRDMQSMWIPASKLIDLDSGKEISTSEAFEYNCRYVCDETIESMARKASKQLKMQLNTSCLKDILFLDNKFREECIYRCDNINKWSGEVNKYV